MIISQNHAQPGPLSAEPREKVALNYLLGKRPRLLTFEELVILHEQNKTVCVNVSITLSE